MATEAKKTIVSPIGTVKFPVCNEPEKNEQGKDVWTISLVLDPKIDKEFLAMLDEESKGLAKPYKADKKKVDGNIVETGLVMVSFKSYFKPRIIDSKMNDIDVQITWGSRVRVGFVCVPYDLKGKKGITKYFSVIQVVELNETAKNPADMGFTALEGYSTEQEIAKKALPWDD